MSHQIEILSETETSIFFNIVERESVIRWVYPSGVFEVVEGNGEDIEIVKTQLANGDLFNKISDKRRWEYLDRIAPIRQPEMTRRLAHISAQDALMEDLETEFPNHFITPHFKARSEHTAFSVGICKQLLTVCLRNDLNRGWGLFWTNDSPDVYIGALTSDNRVPKPVMFTTTGYKILKLCKKYILAWQDHDIQDSILKAVAFPDTEYDNTDRVLELYRSALYSKADREVLEAKNQSPDDILKKVAKINIENIPECDISQNTLNKYIMRCPEPPF